MIVETWCAKCIEASYPPEDRWVVAQAADAYLEWVRSLPEVNMTTRRVAWGD